MDKIPATVLITTATNPPATGMPYLKMTNPLERRIAAKGALYFWVAQGVEKIVIADATGTNLLAPTEVDEISQFGTTLEQVSYQQNQEKVMQKGKGYAEGLLIQFALQNSRLLQESEGFFKSSGKTYVRNFPEIYKMIMDNAIDQMFWRSLNDNTFQQPWADCRFYYTTKEFAMNQLVPAHLQTDDQVAACEYYVFQMLNKTLQNANGMRPLVTGFAGGTARPYSDVSLGYLDANAPCWISQRKR